MSDAILRPLYSSSEDRALHELVTELLTDYEAQVPLLAMIDSGAAHDPVFWRRATSQLGLLEVPLPAAREGLGGGFSQAALVLEAAGYANVRWPYLPCLLAIYGLTLANSTACADRWVPAIVSGEAIGTVALRNTAGGWGGGVHAVGAGPGRWLLTGRRCYVPDGLVADVVLVDALTPAGPALFAVDPTVAGTSRAALEPLDPSRPLASIDFAQAPATLVTRRGSELIEALGVLASAALAAEQAGGMRATLERAVEYADTRIQFGRKIGSFQTIKHRCADMYIRAECGRAVAHSLAGQVDDALSTPKDLVDRALAVSAAAGSMYCGQGFAKSANDMMQIHGGIGFTWEHPAHVYLRRAIADLNLFRTLDEHRALLVDEIQVNGLSVAGLDDEESE